jgi:NitT/TauT family transport system substrate-binding protein
MVLSLAGIMACQKSAVPEDKTKVITVYAPDGAPLLSLTKMWADGYAVEKGYDLQYQAPISGADALTAALMRQTPDIAIAPINIGAKMYTEGYGYVLAGVSIWGIMHIVSNDATLNGLEGLKGKNVFAFAKAGTPGITLRSLLTQSAIAYTEQVDGATEADKVNIIYLTEAGDVRNAIVAGQLNGIDVKYAVLPEPVATAITGASQNRLDGAFSVKINLQDEWTARNSGEMYPQAGLLFHTRLLVDATDQAFLDKFIALAELSTDWALKNPEAAGDIAKAVLNSAAIPGGAPVNVAVKAGRLPLHFTHSAQAKQAVNAYLGIILAENATLVGGKLPDDSFYYSK